MRRDLIGAYTEAMRKSGITVDVAHREYPDDPDAYYGRPFGASVDWTPDSLEWGRRHEEYARLKLALRFFVAVAVAAEEIVDA